ncbi:hypothetical protein RPD_2149 [Rhodopseudomonas palustris BisB5]|uniref:Uncharacterized protein n=1 Tax=Rhodopseudomonas palustris (strain BisB5) TaxID=316057 RepID=Q138V5_RHOPS|nr:hypothetical protein RPD_2149 [Rhodopseudomonas palustris BisB5]
MANVGGAECAGARQRIVNLRRRQSDVGIEKKGRCGVPAAAATRGLSALGRFRPAALNDLAALSGRNFQPPVRP